MRTNGILNDVLDGWIETARTTERWAKPAAVVVGVLWWLVSQGFNVLGLMPIFVGPNPTNKITSIWATGDLAELTLLTATLLMGFVMGMGITLFEILGRARYRNPLWRYLMWGAYISGTILTLSGIFVVRGPATEGEVAFVIYPLILVAAVLTEVAPELLIVAGLATEEVVEGHGGGDFDSYLVREVVDGGQPTTDVPPGIRRRAAEGGGGSFGRQQPIEVISLRLAEPLRCSAPGCSTMTRTGFRLTDEEGVEHYFAACPREHAPQVSRNPGGVLKGGWKPYEYYRSLW